MPTRVETAIREAVRDAAKTLAERTGPLKEAQLAEALRATLLAQLKARQTACEVVKGEHALELAEWPGVGRVDLAIASPTGDPFVFLELKWGGHALYNCVWDLAKMATATARGATYSAYLIAGAADSDWESKLGAELFKQKTWRTIKLLTDPYQQHWEFWKKDVKTHPLLLPVVIRTKPFSSASLVIEGEPWTIKVVDVQASPEDWIDAGSHITVSRWKTHFTWDVGDVDFLTPEQAAEILSQSNQEQSDTS